VNAPFLPLYYTNSGFFGGVGVLSSGNIVAGGTTNEGNTDYCWLVKVTNDGCLDTLWRQTVAAPELPHNKNIVQVWPNPADDFINVEVGLSDAEILLYDSQGQAVRQEKLADRAALPSAALPGGFYFLEIRAGRQAVARRKVIIDH
jgi:hypothetical protein